MKKTERQKDATVTSRNLSGVFLLRIAQFPFLALFMMIIPRTLGPENYGEFAFIISIITIITALVNLGIGEIHGRFVPEFKSRGEWQSISKLFSNLLVFKTVVTLIVCIGLYVIMNITHGERFTAIYFIFIVLTVILRDWGSVFYALLFGLNKMVKFSVRELLRRVLSLSLIFILFHFYGLKGAIGAVFAVEIFLLTLGFVMTKQYFSFKDFGMDMSFLKPYLKFGFLIYISWFLTNLWQRLGNILVDYLTGDPSKVAVFDIANQLFIVIMSISIIIINSLIPTFTKLMMTANEDKMLAWSNRIVKYTIVLNMLFLSAFVFIGSEVVGLIIGKDFTEVYPNILVLMIGLFPLTFAQIGFVYSVIYNQPQTYLYALCSALIVFVGFSLILIPKYSAMGCSIATFASCVVLAFFMIRIYKKQLLLSLQSGLSTILFGVIMVPLQMIKGELITNIALMLLFAGAYFLALFAIKTLSYKEVREIYFSLKGQ